MRKITKYFFIVFVIICAYLTGWPIPIDPVSWNVPSAPKLENKYSINNYLASVDIIHTGELIGPEDVDLDKQGRIYGGFLDGKIVRFTIDGEKEVFADTKGRPLGLDFDKSGNLIVADAKKGLLSINKSGDIEVLMTEIEDVPLNFTDDIDIGPDGMIYFTDASEKFDIYNYKGDLLEHRPHGKLIQYNPDTKESTLLLDSLYFANGVAVSDDGEFLLFNETYDFSISKYWLKGPKSGTREKILTNTPGFPDGVSTGSNGVFWVAMFTPRNSDLDALSAKPFLRKIVYRLPTFLQPAPERHGFVLGIDSNGNVVYNLQDPSPESFSPITSIEEENGMLYLGSLEYAGIARIKRPE